MKLNRIHRLVILIVTGILVLVSTYAFISELAVTKYENQVITTFSANNKADISYEVYLKPNSLYEERILEKGKMAITQYVDYIGINCSYEYNSPQKADISGSYEILADVECYSTQQDSQVTIWKRTFILQPKTGFEKTQSQRLNIFQSLDIPLSQYNDFVKVISDESGINAQTKMTIYMNISAKAVSEEGIVEDILSPSMIVPLNVNYFNIEGTLEQEKPMSIEKTVQVPVPVDYTRVYFMIAADVLLLAALVCILVFTRGIEADPRERLLKSVFNKHGDRMVALKSEIDESVEYRYEVNSIEDLVRISDEVEKPIIYRYSEDHNKINRFYVVHERELYFWDVGNRDIEGKENSHISEETKNLLESINI